MSTSVGRRAAFAVALSLSFVPLACGGERAGEPSAAAQQDSVEMDSAVMALPIDALADSTQPIPVTLEPVNESGVEGRATQIQANDSLRMSLMVQGLPRDGSYPAHIHRGTCVSGGEVVLSLNPVNAESDGMGRSLTTIPANKLRANESHFVQVHGSSGVLACGDMHGS